MEIKTLLKFRPKFIPTIFTIPALIILLSLSYWQFERLEWKLGLIKEIKQRAQMEAIELPDRIEKSTLLYRKVLLKGEFLHGKEMHMYGGSRQFKGEVGYYILVPMRLGDDRVILVNRGWVPEKLKSAVTRPETLPIGKVEVEGVIMDGEKKNLYIHDNQPQRNLWFYINLDEIKAFTNLPIEDFYVLAKDVPNVLPRGRDLETNLRNHHLGYALTWLFSAIALMVVYILYHRKL
jgi:surfeit locus 1 family protein